METITWLLQQGPWLVAASAVGGLALAALLPWGWAWRRFASDHRAKRDALGKPQPGPSGAAGESVTVTGRLRVVEGAIKRAADGKPAAAESLVPTRRRYWGPDVDAGMDFGHRAAALELELAHGALPLSGPVRVLAGSTAWWPGKRLSRLPKRARQRLPDELVDHLDVATARGSVLRAVSDGDEVIVRGCLESRRRDPGPETQGYREAATEHGLTADPEVGAIELVAAAPRFTLPAWRLFLEPLPWVLALASGLLMSYGVHLFDTEESRCHYECANHGRCSPIVRGLVPPRVGCRALTQAHCLGIWGCKREGQCSVVGEGCGVTTDDDCARSWACQNAGRCTADQGRCVAASDRDCARSANCTESGYCKAQDGECVLSEDRGCRDRYGCEELGRCAVVHGRCAVREDADCRASSLCRYAGRCHAEAGTEEHPGECIARSDADCDKSSECELWGQCVAMAGRCVAGSDADCTATDQCRRNGQCRAEGGHCLGDTNPCIATQGCVEQGLCTHRGSLCVVGSDADCRQSNLCRQSGHCSLVEGRCGAMSDADCMNATACQTSGACFASPTSNSCQRGRP
ncbi:MAG: hypothetical protein JRI68_13370 [Deltaproteobacteria bacterium]|nr:hypothetical protein [Deltaproteobacteria bacterium]